MHHAFLLGLPAIGIGLLLLLGLAFVFVVGLLVTVLRWIPHHGLFILVALGMLYAGLVFVKHSNRTETVMVDPPQRGGETARGERILLPPFTPSKEKVPDPPPAQGGDNTSSTAILPTNLEPTPRPDWVGQPPHLEQRGGLEIYFDAVTIGPYSTTAECDREVIPAANRSVRAYAEGHFAGGDEVTLDSQFVQNHLIQARWRETVTTSIGPMQQEHLLLAFDRAVRSEIENRSRDVIIAQRLNSAAGGAGAVLLLVGGVYSLLRWGPRRRPRSFET
jgi:hypothetical protein